MSIATANYAELPPPQQRALESPEPAAAVPNSTANGDSELPGSHTERPRYVTCARMFSYYLL